MVPYAVLVYVRPFSIRSMTKENMHNSGEIEAFTLCMDVLNEPGSRCRAHLANFRVHMCLLHAMHTNLMKAET